jgi:phospholipid-binding lipoprotein MlaA
MTSGRRRRRRLGPLAAALGLAAVATAAHAPAARAAGDSWADHEAQAIADPFEPVNRAVFALNVALQDYALEPAYAAYLGGVPDSVRAVVRNFFDNARLPFSAANATAAGRLDLAGAYAKRFAVNATFGALGTLDVASGLGYRAREAFTVGDVLCAYDVPAGPYVMVPVLGPNNARGLAGRVGDAMAGYAVLDGLYPAYFAGINLNRYGRVRAARRLLDASVDPYLAARSAFAQLDARCGGAP